MEPLARAARMSDIDHHGGIRYCPRCDAETVWTNLPERGERLRCTMREVVEREGREWGDAVKRSIVEGCGFDVEQEFSLTAEQRRRQAAYAERMLPESQQPRSALSRYVFV